MLNKITISLIASSLILGLALSPVKAHGDLEKLTKEEGNFIIDVNYDQTDLEINNSTKISFIIKNKIDEKTPEFDHILVSISKDKTLLFEGPINNPDQILPALTFQFPSSGNYKISTNFQKGGTTVAQTDFTLEVPQIETEEAKNTINPSQSSVAILPIFGGFILGVIPSLIYIVKRRSTSKH